MVNIAYLLFKSVCLYFIWLYSFFIYICKSSIFFLLKFFKVVNLLDNLKEAFSLKLFLLFFVGVGGLLGWVSFP